MAGHRKKRRKSHSEDQKQIYIFYSKYKNERVIAIGEIASTFTFDLIVTMRDSKSTYDLEKGEKIGVSFISDTTGGCFLSYRGVDGIAVKLKGDRN